MLVVFLAWLIWTVGIIFEFEYPYTLVLTGVRNAKSVEGVPVSKIIKGDGEKWGQLHWHTCSYCAYTCGDHDGLFCVQLDAPDQGTKYYFAYSSLTHTLVPMTDHTAAQFPSLMPAGDHMVNVNQLNGKAGTMSVGYGNLELPANWFRTATAAERAGVANDRKIGQDTNRTSSVAESSGQPPR